MNLGYHSFLRGNILYSQRRFDLAEREFFQAIASDPTHSLARAMLALCQCEQKRLNAAIQTALDAIGTTPDEAFCHYALAHVLFRCNHLDRARVAIREAIRLNPESATYFGQSALIEFNSGQWPAALKIAEQGLQLNPEEINANIARVRALDRLGRKFEAKQAALELLRIGPDDEYAHVNTGWSFLECGDHRLALEHFCEALRINPSLELAQNGMVEALKCRFVVYRSGRRLGTWLATQRHQPLTIGTGIFWTLFFLPITILALLALYLRPLLGAWIRFSRFGRLAMTRDQLLESNLTCGATLLSIGCVVAFFVTNQEILFFAAASLFGVSLLTNVAFRARRGRPRWLALSVPASYALLSFAIQLRIYSLQQGGPQGVSEAIDEIGFAYIGMYFLFLILLALSVRISRIIPKV